MKIKLDENLPNGLVDFLNHLGHDADSVLSEGLAGADDQIIWETTQRERRFLLTQDLDFSDTRRFVPGTHHAFYSFACINPDASLCSNAFSICLRLKTLNNGRAVLWWRPITNSESAVPKSG